MRETISVALPGREYDVIIGPDLLAEAGALIAPLLRRKRVAVISESRVATLHLDALRDGLAAAGIEMAALELPPGESTKDWANLQRCVDFADGSVVAAVILVSEFLATMFRCALHVTEHDVEDVPERRP